MYEQNRISHTGPFDEFDLIEAQMIAMTSNGYIGEGSPDRVDALVWALTDLMESPASLNFTKEFAQTFALATRRR